MKGLTPRHAVFVSEYLKDLNATGAYRRAGYKARGNAAEVNASKLLRSPKVAKAVAEAMKAREKRTNITQDRVLQELARIAFFDLRRLYREDGTLKAPNELDDESAAVLSGIDVTEEFSGRGEEREQIGFTKKVRMFDKTAALTLAMRHLGMLNDKLDMNLSGPLAERLARARSRG